MQDYEEGLVRVFHRCMVQNSNKGVRFWTFESWAQTAPEQYFLVDKEKSSSMSLSGPEIYLNIVWIQLSRFIFCCTTHWLLLKSLHLTTECATPVVSSTSARFCPHLILLSDTLPSTWASIYLDCFVCGIIPLVLFGVWCTQIPDTTQHTWRAPPLDAIHQKNIYQMTLSL